MSTVSPDLDELATTIRELPGVRSKRAIGAIADVIGGEWWAGPGDDGAVVNDDGRALVVGGEAMLATFVAHDPFGAGIGAVVANVNDLAAMGALPLAIVDTVTGPADVNRQALEGLQWASKAYGVPVVGGHLSEHDGPPALSAFGLGRVPGGAHAVLSATHVSPGHELVLAGCLEGDMREDFLFFRSFDARIEHLPDDIEIFAEIAESGAAVAAKDISMAGMVGSLAMLLEANWLGGEIDLMSVPVPANVSLSDWLCCFPTFMFLITTTADRLDDCIRAFTRRGLTAAKIGAVDDSGTVRLRHGADSVDVFDLKAESVTGLPR